MKLGKKPARPGAVKLRLNDYVDLSKLPVPPANFGHTDMVRQPWGLLGNDRYGDCYWAGSCHEHMLWGAMGGHKFTFTTNNALYAYSLATGFNKADPNTDQGTDMQQGAAYRQKTGIVDSAGRVHKVGPYLALEKGNLQQQLTAAYIFGAVGLGIEIPASAQEQFEKHEPWDIVPHSPIEGGHYVPLVSHKDGNAVVCTWGALQEMTPQFFEALNDESIVYLSPEILLGGKTIEGFDLQALQKDLAALSR